MIAILFWSNTNYLGITVYDRGLATRLHELTATLFDREETRMFDGLAYMMNDHIYFALWDDYLVIRIGNESASKLVKADPHARLLATDALGEDEDLQNYIDMAILSTCTLPPKAAK
jgi:hypothetical protein